jgi:hypothetical protein
MSRAWLGEAVEEPAMVDGWFELAPASSPVPNAEPVDQFANVEPAPNETDISLVDATPVTEWLPVVETDQAAAYWAATEQAEREHRAALAEIQLPVPPAPPGELYLPYSPWEALRRWLGEVLTIAAGFVLGSLVVYLALAWFVWLTR